MLHAADRQRPPPDPRRSADRGRGAGRARRRRRAGRLRGALPHLPPAPRPLPRPDDAAAGLVEEVLERHHARRLEALPHTYNGQSKVSTWIFAIAYRKALKALHQQDERSSRRRRRAARRADRGPEEQLEHRRRPGRCCCTRWTRCRRSTARWWTSPTSTVSATREIARIVDCPVDTVKTRMFHARRRLSALLCAERGEGWREGAHPAARQRRAWRGAGAAAVVRQRDAGGRRGGARSRPISRSCPRCQADVAAQAELQATPSGDAIAAATSSAAGPRCAPAGGAAARLRRRRLADRAPLVAAGCSSRLPPGRRHCWSLIVALLVGARRRATSDYRALGAAPRQPRRTCVVVFRADATRAADARARCARAAPASSAARPSPTPTCCRLPIAGAGGARAAARRSPACCGVESLQGEAAAVKALLARLAARSLVAARRAPTPGSAVDADRRPRGRCSCCFDCRPPHFRPDGDYAGGYADAAGARGPAPAWRTALAAPATAWRWSTDWPMPLLGLDCYVMDGARRSARRSGRASAGARPRASRGRSR